MTDLQTLLEAISADLGDPSNWDSPVEFRDSLALCALNSAYSLSAHSTSGKNVLARYRALRPTADTDGGPDLLSAMDDAGGPEGFAQDVLCNHSKLPGTRRLRTVAIYEGLTRLSALHPAVTTNAHLRAAASDSATRRAWLSVLGFGPLAWFYLLMNAGVGTETKPDVMVQRYLTRALRKDHQLTSEQTRQLLRTAAKNLGVQPRTLDRAIWLHESPSVN